MTGDRCNKGKGMSGFWKKRFAIHRAASITIVVAYALVICMVDLFHDEGCMAGHKHAHAARVILNNDLCPACVFSAGSNATQVCCESGQLIVEWQVTPQPVPYTMPVKADQWTCCIVLRAPPSVGTS